MFIRGLNMKQFIIKYLIPKSYKNKYKDKVGNRKYTSGYWFDFIIPRTLVPYRPGIYGSPHIVRWLNFFFVTHKNYKEVDIK